eukprot:5589406-Pyramimonas_sp.AAC.1
MFAGVAKLKLNFKKCQIIGCGELDLCILEKTLGQFGDPVNKLLVDSWAIYLGVPTGPHGHLHVWDTVIVEFRKRIRLTRALGLSLALSAMSVRVMCVSLLQYRLQMYPASLELIQCFKEGVRLLTIGPRHAISYELATQLSA